MKKYLIDIYYWYEHLIFTILIIFYHVRNCWCRHIGPPRFGWSCEVSSVSRLPRWPWKVFGTRDVTGILTKSMVNLWWINGIIIYLVGGLEWNMAFIFHTLGMSSSQPTIRHIFQRGRAQPPSRNIVIGNNMEWELMGSKGSNHFTPTMWGPRSIAFSWCT